MRPQLFILFLLLAITSCKDKNNNHHTEPSYPSSSNNSSYSPDNQNNEEQNNDEKYSDDTYCAEVEYYNPNTGTHSSYTLTVEIESNEITQINFPNGGWLDNDHFSSVELEEDGTASFTSDKGYEYEITIIGSSRNCFTDNISSAVQCRGETEDGNQCENMTDNSNGLCWQHQDQE
jgi:hypothetical protein